jgi:hypothetical protein
MPQVRPHDEDNGGGSLRSNPPDWWPTDEEARAALRPEAAVTGWIARVLRQETPRATRASRLLFKGRSSDGRCRGFVQPAGFSSPADHHVIGYYRLAEDLAQMTLECNLDMPCRAAARKCRGSH